MRMISTPLALAVAVGLGSAASANAVGKHDRAHEGADHAAMQHADDTMKPHDHAAMQARDHERSSTDASHPRAVVQRVGEREADRLSDEFRRLDSDDDGLVEVATLAPSGRNNVAIFDADDDGFIDRYEYEMAFSARFDDLDRDGNGRLSREETAPVKPESVTWAALDVDNDQALSAEEYRKFIESGDWARDRDRYAFDYVDRDRSGSIDSREAAVFVPLASSFKAYDPDGDGLVERTEYTLFLAEVERQQQGGDRVADSDTGEEPRR